MKYYRSRLLDCGTATIRRQTFRRRTNCQRDFSSPRQMVTGQMVAKTFCCESNRHSKGMQHFIAEHSICPQVRSALERSSKVFQSFPGPKGCAPVNLPLGAFALRPRLCLSLWRSFHTRRRNDEKTPRRNLAGTKSLAASCLGDGMARNEMSLRRFVVRRNVWRQKGRSRKLWCAQRYWWSILVSSLLAPLRYFLQINAGKKWARKKMLITLSALPIDQFWSAFDYWLIQKTKKGNHPLEGLKTAQTHRIWTWETNYLYDWTKHESSTLIHTGHWLGLLRPPSKTPRS